MDSIGLIRFLRDNPTTDDIRQVFPRSLDITKEALLSSIVWKNEDELATPPSPFKEYFIEMIDRLAAGSLGNYI